MSFQEVQEGQAQSMLPKPPVATVVSTPSSTPTSPQTITLGKTTFTKSSTGTITPVSPFAPKPVTPNPVSAIENIVEPTIPGDAELTRGAVDMASQQGFTTQGAMIEGQRVPYGSFNVHLQSGRDVTPGNYTELISILKEEQVYQYRLQGSYYVQQGYTPVQTEEGLVYTKSERQILSPDYTPTSGDVQQYPGGPIVNIQEKDIRQNISQGIADVLGLSRMDPQEVFVVPGQSRQALYEAGIMKQGPSQAEIAIVPLEWMQGAFFMSGFKAIPEAATRLLPFIAKETVTAATTAALIETGAMFGVLAVKQMVETPSSMREFQFFVLGGQIAAGMSVSGIRVTDIPSRIMSGIESMKDKLPRYKEVTYWKETGGVTSRNIYQILGKDIRSPFYRYGEMQRGLDFFEYGPPEPVPEPLGIAQGPRWRPSTQTDISTIYSGKIAYAEPMESLLWQPKTGIPEPYIKTGFELTIPPPKPMVRPTGALIEYDPVYQVADPFVTEINKTLDFVGKNWQPKTGIPLPVEIAPKTIMDIVEGKRNPLDVIFKPKERTITTRISLDAEGNLVGTKYGLMEPSTKIKDGTELLTAKEYFAWLHEQGKIKITWFTDKSLFGISEGTEAKMHRGPGYAELFLPESIKGNKPGTIKKDSFITTEKYKSKVTGKELFQHELYHVTQEPSLNIEEKWDSEFGPYGAFLQGAKTKPTFVKELPDWLEWSSKYPEQAKGRFFGSSFLTIRPTGTLTTIIKPGKLTIYEPMLDLFGGLESGQTLQTEGLLKLVSTKQKTFTLKDIIKPVQKPKGEISQVGKGGQETILIMEEPSTKTITDIVKEETDRLIDMDTESEAITSGRQRQSEVTIGKQKQTGATFQEFPPMTIQKQDTRLLSIFKPMVETKQKELTLSGIKQEQERMQSFDVLPVSLTGILSKQLQVSDITHVSKQIQENIFISGEVIVDKIQKIVDKIIPRVPQIETPFEEIIKPPRPTLWPEEESEEKGFGNNAFIVGVRGRQYRHGKKIGDDSFHPISGPLSFDDAMSLGVHEAGSTEKAAFMVEAVNMKPRKGRELPSWANEIYKYNQKEKDIWVEQPRFRIDSPGEIQAITMKGMEARMKL